MKALLLLPLPQMKLVKHVFACSPKAQARALGRDLHRFNVLWEGSQEGIILIPLACLWRWTQGLPCSN